MIWLKAEVESESGGDSALGKMQCTHMLCRHWQQWDDFGGCCCLLRVRWRLRRRRRFGLVGVGVDVVVVASTEDILPECVFGSDGRNVGDVTLKELLSVCVVVGSNGPLRLLRYGRL